MKYFNKIDAKDIYLSPISIDDAHMYVKWLSDIKINKNLHGASKVYTLESVIDWINNALKNGDYIFSIIRKSDDKLIGNVGFNKINLIDRTATLGIFIGDIDNHHKGYGTQAIKSLIEYGFDVLNLNNIDLQVFDFNEKAIACYKKIGFKEYGRRHSAYYLLWLAPSI